MSNPTTDEWTSKSVWNLLDEGGGEMVAAAHNSALTTTREYAAKYTQELREQLKDAQDEAFGAYAEADALREQLIAEREKRESIETINKSLARAVDNPCR